jgi:hypothetical protein
MLLLLDEFSVRQSTKSKSITWFVYRSILRKLKSYEWIFVFLEIEYVRRSSSENPDGLSEANQAAVASASQSSGSGTLSSVLLLLLLLISL